MIHIQPFENQINVLHRMKCKLRFLEEKSPSLELQHNSVFLLELFMFSKFLNILCMGYETIHLALLTRSEICQDSLSRKYWIAFRCANDWSTCLCRGGSSTSSVVTLYKILLWISASLCNSLCTTFLTVKARLSILLALMGSESCLATVFS